MFIFLLVIVYIGLMIVAVVLAIKEEFLGLFFLGLLAIPMVDSHLNRMYTLEKARVECPKGGAK